MFNLISVYGQKIDNDTLINDIKNDVTSFFKKQGVLKKDESNKNVFISELFDEKVIGFNSIGIYIIGVFQSHSQKHILIKENSKYKIYDIKQIDIVLKDVIDFSKRNKIGDDKMLFYLKGIIERYDANYHPNYTSIEKRQ
jgi:hypothetical protein